MAAMNSYQSYYGNILRGERDAYERDFAEYEQYLLGQLDDTSLIDAARPEAEAQNALAAGISQRNLSRYGGAAGLGMTPVELQERARAASLGGALNVAGSLNNARLAQEGVNQSTLSELMNIGNISRQMGLSGLQNAAALEAQRQAAYRNAAATSSAQNRQLGFSLLNTALTASLFGI